MPIKVCFVSNYAYRLFNPQSRIVFGGIETIFYLVAKNLTEDPKFKVSFLLEDDVHRRAQEENWAGIRLFKTLREKQPVSYPDRQVEKYHRWFTYWAGKYQRLWRLPHLDFFRLWEKLKQINADVYIFAYPSYESLLLTIIAKIIRKKSVYAVVNDEILTGNKLYFFVLRLVDILWCFSPRHQQILRKRYWIRAINLPCWFPRPKKITSRQKRQYLLWVGRAEERKKPEAFLRLAKHLPEINFLMITAVSPQEPGLYKKIIIRAQNLPNLTIKHDVMFNSLDRYYRHAIALVDTSFYKNLNMTQVQAAHFMVPCLSYFYDPNYSFEQYGWGFSAGGDFNKLLKNTRIVVRQPALWQQLAENGYRFAEAVYNQENNLPVFKKIILQLIK